MVVTRHHSWLPLLLPGTTVRVVVVVVLVLILVSHLAIVLAVVVAAAVVVVVVGLLILGLLRLRFLFEPRVVLGYCFQRYRTSHQVAWRRFFTFTWALEDLDRSWTARYLAGRYLVPRASDLLGRPGASSGPEEVELADRAAAEDAEANAPTKATDPFEALKKRRKCQVNMLEFSTGVLSDREYQYLARCMLAAILPLRTSYVDAVKTFSKGLVSTCHWQACRSVGGWQVELMRIVGAWRSPQVLTRCGISTLRAAPCPAAATAAGGQHADDEHAMAVRASALTDLLLATAGNFAWYMLKFSVCFPDVLAATLHPKLGAGQAGLDKARVTWNNASVAFSTRSAQALCEDLHWAKNQPVCHELVHVLESHNWQVRSAAVRRAAFIVFGGIVDTKRVLEDCFAALKNASQRNKNRHMSKHHGYFEAAFAECLNPAVKATDGGTKSGIPSLFPLSSDWQVLSQCKLLCSIFSLRPRRIAQ